MREAAADDRAVLSGYLLGQLDEDEADRVEDRFAADDVYFTLYLEVERLLVRDYAAGTMEPADAALFERNYLVTPERQRQVAIVRALKAVQDGRQPTPPAQVPFGRMLVPALALSVLVVVGVYWNHRRPARTTHAVVLRQVPIPAFPPKPEIHPGPTQTTHPAPVPERSTPTLQAEATSPQPLPASSPGTTLEQQLESHYALTTLTADNRDVLTAGSVLIVRKSGQVPDFGTAFASRDSMNGEKLYVTKITVDRGGNAIVFDVISAAYGDAGRQKASLRFDVPKDALAAGDLAQIEPILGQVFKIAPAEDQNAAAPRGQPPPPPPAAPKELKIGMTVAEIEASFGPPSVKISVGNKITYSYNDVGVKIVFTEGKVSAIQ